MKKRWIALLCVIVIGGGVWMMSSAISNRKYHNDTLEACSVSTGGGMLGGSETFRLKQFETGAVLSVMVRKTHADREITTSYRVGDEALEHLADMAARYHLYAASKRRYSKMRVLDGDTTTISFDFSKGYFSVCEEQVLSATMREGFRAVADYLKSLAVGDGVVTKEKQKAVLYLKSGYTLQFLVEDVFDGRLDAILSEERSVSAFEKSGIVLAAGEAPDLSDAQSEKKGEAGTIVYDPQGEQIVLLYKDHTFEQGVYLLARLDGDPATAEKLIAEMEGPYSLYLN